MPTTAFKPDRNWLTGLVFLLLSFTLFIIYNVHHTGSREGLFFFHYLLVIIYFVVLWSSQRLRRDGNSLPQIFLLLTLALVSCYALNQEMCIFEPAASWWAALLVIACINYSTFIFFHRLPRFVQQIVCFVAGVSLLCFLYLALFLAPDYIFGLLAAFVIGVSLHVFVPALFVIYTVVFYLRTMRRNKRLSWSFFAGLFLSLAFITQFVIRWDLRVNAINRSWSEARTNRGNLPPWIAVAQACTHSALDEQIIKSKAEDFNVSDAIFGWKPRFVLEEARRHDPLLVIATLLCGSVDLETDDRLKILNSIFDGRHKTENRLWSGEDLVTTDVATEVQVWPQLHLSYTEENITVANKADTSRWFTPTDEALYTFHLPEGAVVSALSLWIDGKEQKARLTSRQQADSAYTTVVGRFRRDPSVVHWQEGNTVVVRVFPVSATEPRRFKLGITAPLEKNGRNLLYHSITFEGPPTERTRGSIRILPMERLIHPVWPASFRSDSAGLLHRRSSLLSLTAAAQAPIGKEGDYVPNWSFQCEDPGIESTTFHFGGKRYTTATPTITTTAPSFRQVYLDLNSAWTREEFESLLASLVNVPVYASLTGEDLVNVTGRNKQEVFDAAAKRLFSLFPLSRIRDYRQSLFISKSSPWSPNLADLDGSPFARQLQAWLAQGGQMAMYNIGDEISPYLRTLREAGAFEYEKGDLYTLQSHLHHNAFPRVTLAANELLIEPAGLLIRRTDDSAGRRAVGSAAPRMDDSAADRTDKPRSHLDSMVARFRFVPPRIVVPDRAAGEAAAPDHLLRLFAYSRILEQLKGRLPASYNDTDSTTATQVEMAEEAGIVSPVSSYVVLETKADYDRWGIRDNKNALQNAGIQGKGAVPEPGEWALLIGILALLAYIRYRGLHKKRRSSISQ